MKKSNILDNLTYNEDKPAISVLFETESTKEIRIVFKQGQVMKKHQTPFPIAVELFEGTLDFGVENEIHSLKKGDILALDGGIPHDLSATANCVVRLTLSKKDSVQRVKDVVK